jgi:CheY-like chemotaxis protein
MSNHRRILIVDDSPAIHEDMRGVLGGARVDYSEVEDLERKLFAAEQIEPVGQAMDLESAYQGEEAVALVRKASAEGRPFSMAFVDMRMPPGWDGIQTITELWRLDPDLQVVICTAYSDHSWSEIVARLGVRDNLLILKKPFEAIEVVQLAHALTEKWSLKMAEQTLLEKTLQGSIKALVDVLALTNPRMFGRADRVRRLVSSALDRLQVKVRWPFEVAAMVSQLGWIALPAETAVRARAGQALSAEEQAMVSRIPAITEQLLQNIPRLEIVCAIISGSDRGLAGDIAPHDTDQTVLLGRGLLKLATEFEQLTARGVSARVAIDTLRARSHDVDPVLLDVFASVHDDSNGSPEMQEVSVRGLRVGMIIAEDLLLKTGVLLAPRGYEVTAGMMERLRNFTPGALKEPVRIIRPRTAA